MIVTFIVQKSFFRLLLFSVLSRSLISSFCEAAVIPPLLNVENAEAPKQATHIQASPSSKTKDYTRALDLSISFYNSQRSGQLPNDSVHWRGDSALDDCIPGGWYNGGDHVKFASPIATTTTMLLWGAEKFLEGYQEAGQLERFYEMIKWPLEFFLRSWNPETRELVVQVGDPIADHSYWGRPEHMTMVRPCLVVNAKNTGSDVAASISSSLAAGSVVFGNKGDKSLAMKLAQVAEEIYLFAKTNRGIFYGSSPFYLGDDDKDDLCEAAVWLYKATKKPGYKRDALSFAHSIGKTMPVKVEPDDKSAICQLLLHDITHSGRQAFHIRQLFQSWLPGGRVAYTPCGMAWLEQNGATGHTANMAFLAFVAADLGLDSHRLRQWATEQINYMLGDSRHDSECFSYQIGFGSKFPMKPHHRGASCPEKGKCTKGLTSTERNPNILFGGLVAGPDVSGYYTDVRSDYSSNGVSIERNAGFQGALAGILRLKSKGLLPRTENRCPCEEPAQ